MTTKEELRAELGAASVELQKTAARLETVHAAAHSACCVWERTPSASLHDIRMVMRTLRDVLGRPNLVADTRAATAEARVRELDAHRQRLALEAGELRKERGEHLIEIAALKKELAETTDDALKQRVEYWRESSQAAEARVRELEALMQRDCDEYRDGVRDAQLAQQAAESKCAALRAVAESHVKDNIQLGEDNERLRAEVERLLDTNAMQLGQLQHSREQLAAANALLGQPTAPSDADSEFEHARAMTKARRNGGMNRE